MTRRPITVYLGLGSNLGDREGNVQEALRLLGEHIRLRRVSSLYETAPVGHVEQPDFLADQPDFLNAVACGVTTLAPDGLLELVKGIESTMGRPKGQLLNAPRTIDVDILLLGRTTVAGPDVMVPHPRIAERAFVLVPLAEIAPGARHPVLKQTARTLLAKVDPAGVRLYGGPPPLGHRVSRSEPPSDGRGDFVELRLTVDRELVEPVAELFARQGRARVAILEAGYATEWSDEVPPAGAATVSAYLPATPLGIRRVARVESGLAVLRLIAALPPLETRAVKRETWESALRGDFTTRRIGRSVVIRPSWESGRAMEGDAVVILEPGIAFGTGHHPTTRLCIEALESALPPGVSVLDIGTGSGILAITAAVLGASRVLGTDTDPQAVRSARQNVRLNRLQRRVTVRKGTLYSGGEHYGIIVGNLTARVLQQVLPEASGLLAPGGTLIASGFLKDQAKELREAAEASGLVVSRARSDGDWHCWDLQRVSRSST